MDMYNFTRLLEEISALARERNEMLKDSQYAEFALSDEAIQKEAMQTASEIFQKGQSEAFQATWNKSWASFSNIRVK